MLTNMRYNDANKVHCIFSIANRNNSLTAAYMEDEILNLKRLVRVPQTYKTNYIFNRLCLLLQLSCYNRSYFPHNFTS